MIIFVVFLGNGYEELYGGFGERNYGFFELLRYVRSECFGLGGGG